MFSCVKSWLDLYVSADSWLADPGNLDFSCNYILISGLYDLHLLQETEMVRHADSVMLPVFTFSMYFVFKAFNDN